MEAKFTIPYSEYAVIEELGTLLKKSKGYSIYIPTSRQQKWVDFLIHNSQTNKYLRFQVKSSRSYTSTNSTLNNNEFRNTLWFNNFITRYSNFTADYYILFGLYPLYFAGKSINSKKDIWKKIILCFTDTEMKNLLGSVLTKKEKKPDRFFYIGFDSPEKVFGTRGFISSTDSRPIDLSQHLINEKLDEIIQSMT